jgi:hypothetical protein
MSADIGWNTRARTAAGHTEAAFDYGAQKGIRAAVF